MSNYNNHLNMKKLTLTTLVIFISLGAYAQFNQGRMLVTLRETFAESIARAHSSDG